MKGIAKIKRTDGQYEKINLCGYKQAEESAANAPVNVDWIVNRKSDNIYKGIEAILNRG